MRMTLLFAAAAMLSACQTPTTRIDGPPRDCVGAECSYPDGTPR